MSLKAQFLKHIEELLKEYEREEKCGIFFKLEKGKDPSEIIGVLDFLKYKIENWGNTNIFSYYGRFFNENTILVIGSSNSEEATNIIKHIYLSHIIKNVEEVDTLIETVPNFGDLENFLTDEISENIKNGHPSDPKLEMELVDHIKKLLKE
ncbi:MAG: hypothetical protein ACXABO_13405 [Promethearchaeota archaeon]|jgi:hypothetical protein